MLRRDDLITESCQFLQVILHDWIMVHVVIHCRGHQDSASTSHDRGTQHIVRNPPGKLTHNVCRSRSNQHEVCLFGQCHMLHRELKIAVKCINQALIAGKGLKRGRRDEVGGILCHQHMHLAVQLFQHTRHIGHFIRRNPAGNAQKHCFSL